jgi:uncharacterized protein YbcI
VPPDRASTGDGRLFGGELNSAIVNGVVGVHSRRLGRGPTGASAFYRDNVVVVLMQDGLTQAERTVAAGGGEDAVRSVRGAYRDAVHDELVGVVESLTGRHVLALLCDQSVSPDLSTEVFVLDASV